MVTIPWHPAVVHIPLGLTIVLPLLALILWGLIRRGKLHASAWVAVIVLQAFIFVGAVIALKTGELDEHRVERIVRGGLVGAHEDKGEQFLWVSGIAFALSLVGYLLKASERPSEKVKKTLTVASYLGIFVSMVAAFLVGKSGGELVYKHGAAGAAESADDSAILHELQNSQGVIED